jgi:hypothetical protein
MIRLPFVLNVICSLSFAQVVTGAGGTGTPTQDKPRVYVSGRGTQNSSTHSTSSINSSPYGNHWFSSGHSESTSDAHDEGMEVTRDLQKECPGIMVTFNQSAADYTVMLNRESKQKRSVLRTNSQVQVLNREGDVIGSNATRTVNSASKNACSLMLSDWALHGRIAAPPQPVQAETPQSPAVPIPVATTSPQQPNGNGEHRIEGYTTSEGSSGMGSASDTMSLGDASRLAKAKKAAAQQQP